MKRKSVRVMYWFDQYDKENGVNYSADELNDYRAVSLNIEGFIDLIDQLNSFRIRFLSSLEERQLRKISVHWDTDDEYTHILSIDWEKFCRGTLDEKPEEKEEKEVESEENPDFEEVPF